MNLKKKQQRIKLLTILEFKCLIVNVKKHKTLHAFYI